ncbi:MAG TPA: SCO1664 family protein, partial [Candidatus Limnocylindrales bacterium]|nr:SCO1664 family protein [Candidatus Limnocylindrales bacterium]
MRQPARSGRPHLPAQERAVRQLTSDASAPADATSGAGHTAVELDLLRSGRIELVGRLVESSNNALLARLRGAAAEKLAWVPGGDSPLDGLGRGFYAVWKPTAGERPLFDFPVRTLTRREVAAFAVSEALGWAIVPSTVLRDGPYGEGMLQRWVEVDPGADVVAILTGDDPRLRRIALFDAIVNNTDRKGGHILPIDGGRHVHGVDHGVCFSSVPKLRTVLWGWRGQRFSADELAGLARIREGLDADLGARLRELLAPAEIRATSRRVDGLLESGRFPLPS